MSTAGNLLLRCVLETMESASSAVAGKQFGRPESEAMRQGGVDTTVDLRDFALVGITEVIKDFPRAYRTFNRLIEEVDRRKPALAVLIDSPSLNMRLAKKLKRRNIRVIYFVSPQIW